MATLRVSPTFLVRPKERTLEGVCEYLELEQSNLAAARTKKVQDKDEIEFLEHRIKILTLKKAKFQRMKDDKQVDSNAESEAAADSSASDSSSPTTPLHPSVDAAQQLRARLNIRKDSTMEAIERVNNEFDDQTSDLVLSDAMSLLGNSIDLSRFMTHFVEDAHTSHGGFQQTKMIYAITRELETAYGFGDELLAKQILMTGLKVKTEFDLGEALLEEIGKMDFSDTFLKNVFTIISSKHSAEFTSEKIFKQFDDLSVLLSSDLEQIAASLSGGRSKLLDAVVKAVGNWGELLEITDQILDQTRRAELNERNIVIDTKKRLGRHIANMFSAVSFSTSSMVESGAWNMESATSMLDEGIKSSWRVTTELIRHSTELFTAYQAVKSQETAADDGRKKSVNDEPDINRAKLEKFFGAAPPVPKKKDKFEYVIAEAKFDKSLFFNMEGQVKGGTLEKLVERVTHHSIIDETYASTFLLSYPTFTDPLTLINLLIGRFLIEPPEELTEEERQYFIEKKSNVVKQRVATMLRQMIEMDYDVITSSPDCVKTIESFVKGQLAEKLPAQVPLIEAALSGRKTETVRPPDLASAQSSPSKKDLSEKPPKPIIPRALKRGEVSILFLDPLEAARQLTLIDFALFTAIKPREFQKLAWSKKDTSHRAPNIIRLIKRATQLTSFVCHTILEQAESKNRSDALRIWIQIADRCRQIRNYNSLMAINAGLMSSSIHRLQRSWRILTKRDMLMYEEIKTLMSYQRNFGNYRKLLRSPQLPCFPFLGLYLTDLTFIEDGNKDFLANSDFINYDKRTKAAKVVDEIASFQKVKFNFEPVKEIEDFLLNIEKFEKNEEEFYEISQRVEKKETESDVLVRVLADSGFL